METLRWLGGPADRGGRLRLLEQTLLPRELRYVEIESVAALCDAILRLAVRGAPAIGVAGAYGVLLGAQQSSARDAAGLAIDVERAAATLFAVRPTAVNLGWATARMVEVARRAVDEGADVPVVLERLHAAAHRIHAHDRSTCQRIGDFGAALLRDGSTVLTHCNAGRLATAGIGTALAPIYVAQSQGKRVRVFADETRPLLQGARLTAFELRESGVEVTVIADNMAGKVLSEGRVDRIFVGADRIAANGDVCNKIGTYPLAVLAREHGVPFHVCAPLSTFDPHCPDGKAIPIEQRDPREVTEGFGQRTAPVGVSVYNPAFDVTPARLVASIVTEWGLVEQPDRDRVAAVLARGAAEARELRGA